MLLAVIFLVSVWIGILNRADSDKDRAIEDALTNHSNTAHSVANYTTQMIERLRFYSRTLALSESNQATKNFVHSALIQDKAFLRLMHFDEKGQLLFNTGRKPEPWLIDAATKFALNPYQSNVEKIIIGAVPTNEYAHVWDLPIIFQPAFSNTPGSFSIALVDLGYFSKRFEDINLGESGEVVLLANDGRELLRLHGSRLDSVESIVGTERFKQAFAQRAGTATELSGDNHVRLYAFKRVPSSPLATLVSRTSDDVLKEIITAQRGYWGATLLLTLLTISLIYIWMRTNRRRQSLIRRLTLAQENNLRLINQIGAEKELAYHMASHDKLTGLPNRMLFGELANRYVDRAKRAHGRFAVLFIDIDRFKPINDTYGHKAGDNLLIQLSQRLQQCMRNTDVVSRYGGDEFVALVADLRGSLDAAVIARKIIDSLSQPYVGIVETDLNISSSIGIAFYPDDAEVIDTLIRQADAAMYQAKGKRATFAFSDPSLNRRSELRNKIEAALPAALKKRQIHVHYQPKVSLRDFSITGVEALARWTHPKLGVLSPADFIPVAEECGAIIGLGEYIIDEVCRQLKVWLLAGVPMVPVAVNISSLQLRSPRLYDYIVGALARHGVEPYYLEIEITETGLIDTESFIDTLRRLDALGIHLAIDDFGTGYSGLSHLRALPVSYLKIDRSFVKDIRNESNDAAIVSNTISLAHNLNLETIAEGVETQEQIAHLKAARCDQAQGYFFSPPCDATAVETLLRLKFISIGIQE